jgi:hypothetical protein
MSLTTNDEIRRCFFLSLTERCLSLLNQCFHHAAQRLSPPSHTFEQFSRLSSSSDEDREKIHSLFDSLQFSFVQSHPTLLQGLLHLLTCLSFVSEEKMFNLLSSFHSSLQFDRFDVEQTSEQEFHLTCFTDICEQHLGKKHSSISTKAFVEILNRQDGGVIDQAIHYIQLH